MNGSLRVKNGIYQAVISYKDSEGRYKQKWISTGLKERGNRKEAKKFLEAQLEKFKNEKQDIVTTLQARSDISFMDYMDEYVQGKQTLLSQTTIRGYKNLCSHMRRYFGNKLKLQDVTYQHLLKFYQYLKESRGLKNTSITKYKEILAPALNNAYRDNLILKNPYDFMPKLKREKPKREYYDVEELEKLFEVADKTHMGLLIRVAGCYGFRRSELLGLRWKSIDFKRKTITIENKIINIEKKVIASNVLKTLTSNRTLPLLPDIELRLLQRREEIENNKRKYKKSYCYDYEDYVFVDDLGKLYLPDYVTMYFRKLLIKNNLKLIRFHDLRHSCASLLANRKIPMKHIQEWLGHSSYTLTADTYSHLNYESKLESANVISKELEYNPQEPKILPTENANVKSDINEYYDSLSNDEIERQLQELEKLKLRRMQKREEAEM